MVSRWPSLPGLDESRKFQSCTAEAGDTCLSQRSSLSSFCTVFVKSGVPDDVPPWLTGPHSFQGWMRNGEEGGKTLSLMNLNYFLLSLSVGFQQHPGNRGRALSGSLYSLTGSQGGRR